MGKRSALRMTAADVQAHQTRHGFTSGQDKTHASEPTDAARPFLTPVKMTRPEREYGLILEAMRSRGEILRWRRWGIKLGWGEHKDTGRLMYYTPDFLVYLPKGEFGLGRVLPVCIEVKGAHVWAKDLIRFKGCRAEWQGEYAFEMHQLSAGQWRRVA